MHRLTTLLFVLAAASAGFAQNPTEADYYKLEPVPIPEGVVLEAGGLELMSDGKLAVSTRRGDIYMVNDPFAEDISTITMNLWAEGLHEVLGLSQHNGWLYATQRPEVTRIKDTDGDGEADLFETVSDDWEINGDYHEYAFGSKFDDEGNMWVVLCLTGSFSSNVPYRGWCVRVSAAGKMIPTTSGIRSPGGIGMTCNGDVFYSDNQGPWNGTSSIKHLVPGEFVGHPGGFNWYDLPEVKAAIGERLPEPKSGSRFHTEAARLPKYRPPAVLMPHGKVGNSTSGISCDHTGGKFGPFSGQLFVSDQTHSVVNRVYLEKIDGQYQGACIPFRSGFGSGNVPSLMCDNGTLFVGGTDRGWGARGGKRFALDRVTWTGKMPFEVLQMNIQRDGFELVFTKPVDVETASDIASYSMKTYTYIFQGSYGSPEVDHTTPTIKKAIVSDDGLRVRLVVDGLQIGHVHELTMPGVRDKASSHPVLHPIAYYTLWKLPAK